MIVTRTYHFIWAFGQLLLQAIRQHIVLSWTQLSVQMHPASLLYVFFCE